MPVHYLIAYSNNYAKTSGSVWQNSKDDPNDNIIDFESFKFKARIAQKTPANGNTKNVETTVLLKYLSKCWRTLEILLINNEITLMFTNCVITNSTCAATFAIT